jgi:hypothetical protein
MAGHATHVLNEFRRWRKIFNNSVTVDEGGEKEEVVDPNYTEKTTRRRPPALSEEEENASAWSQPVRVRLEICRRLGGHLLLRRRLTRHDGWLLLSRSASVVGPWRL